MHTPRRRAAGRPAGPPDPAGPAVAPPPPAGPTVAPPPPAGPTVAPPPAAGPTVAPPPAAGPTEAVSTPLTDQRSAAVATGAQPPADAQVSTDAQPTNVTQPTSGAQSGIGARSGIGAASGGTRDAADGSQHRRRERAPRGSAAAPAGEQGASGGPAERSTGAAPAAGTASAAGKAPAAGADPAAGTAPAAEPPSTRRPAGSVPARDERRRGESAVERSLRALVSTRTTQLPFDVAMRAREVAAPSAQDLAEAERDLVLVRRHYVPPAPLTTKKGEGARGNSGRTEEAAGRGEARRGGRRSGRG